MLIEYLLFIGSGLYLLSSVMFLYLFIRTLRTRDGIGLVFLKILTFGIFIGSLSVFSIRILSEYGFMDYQTARAIAVINPMILVGVAFYLNYLFHQKIKSITTDIKKTVTEKVEKTTTVDAK